MTLRQGDQEKKSNKLVWVTVKHVKLLKHIKKHIWSSFSQLHPSVLHFHHSIMAWPPSPRQASSLLSSSSESSAIIYFENQRNKRSEYCGRSCPPKWSDIHDGYVVGRYLPSFVGWRWMSCVRWPLRWLWPHLLGFLWSLSYLFEFEVLFAIIMFMNGRSIRSWRSNAQC